MIEPWELVEAARRRGLEWYAGVPCSFLTPLINHLINDERLTYIASANEGDALATAAGAAVGGRRACVMMQNSGLGNAVNPLTSLTYVFHIPLLVICTWRGEPGVTDEPQHQLMGRITPRLFETMELPWEVFPRDPRELEPVLARAEAHLARKRRPYALLMRKDTLAPCPLRKGILEGRARLVASRRTFFRDASCPSRMEALKRVVALTPEKGMVLVATTGHLGRELFALSDRANHLYLVGSMGCASSFGLGLALARPDLRIVVLDGDGACLMRMGNLATIGAYAPSNLIHLVFDNEVHDSTGAQATVSRWLSFAGIAEACGYPMVMEGDDLGLLDALFAEDSPGPKFGHLKIRPGTPEHLPRPNLSPEEVLRRLMAHIGSGA